MISGRGAFDLVLVNPPGRSRIYQSLGADLAAIEPPVWAGLMAAFVRRRGHRVAILDANALGLEPAQVADQVADWRPRLAAIVVFGQQPSASTQVMPAAGKVAAAIRARDPATPVVLVGGHVAALPERTIREEAASFVAGGEGLFTLVDLLEALETPRPDFSKVREIYFLEAGEVRRGPPAPLVLDLDRELPEIPWELLPMDRYRAHNWHCLGGRPRQPYAAFYTTLGCPFRCAFCCIQAPFREGERAAGLPARANSYRKWSPATVLSWVDRLASEFGVTNIKIADEMFVLSPSHVRAIAEGLAPRAQDLNLWAYARVDTVRPDMVSLLAQSAFRWLAFGVESASDRVRDGVDKSFAGDQVKETLERVRAAGIHVIANYIFGLPDDDLDSMTQTLDLALELRTEFANFYSAMAYPGSPLYDQALARSWPLPASWSGYSQHAVDTLPLPTLHLSSAEVLRFRDRAFRTYFTDPGYLDLVQRKFGAAAVEEVRRMTRHTLEREI